MKKYLLSICLLITLTGNIAFAQWTSLNGPPLSNVNKVVSEINTGKAYALVGNEVFATTNEGVTWQKANTPANIYIYDMLLDGTSIYVTDYSRLYKSTDGGANWNLASPNYEYGLYRITRVSTNTFIASYYWEGLKITKDGGATWTKFFNSNDTDGYVNHDAVIANAAGDIYFITTKGLKRHLNPGAGAWSPANVTLVDETITGGLIAAQGNSIYLASSSDIVRSPSGNTGTFVSVISNITETYFGDGKWALAPNNDLYFINNNVKKVYSTTSVSGGAAWTIQTSWPTTNFSGSPILCVGFTNSIKAYVGTSEDGIFQTTNSGSTWSPKSFGINKGNLRQIEIAANGRMLVLAGGYSTGYWYSDDQGNAWSYRAFGEGLSKIEKLADNTLLIYNTSRVYYSADNGDTWLSTNRGSYEIIEDANGVLYSTVNASIASSSDNGVTWTEIVISGFPSGHYGYDLAIDANGKIYAFIEYYEDETWKKALYKVTLSSPFVGTAIPLTTPENFDGDSFGSLFVNGGKLYYNTNKNIHYSSDEGGLWNTIDINNSYVLSLPGGIGVSSYGSFYITQNDGQTWSSTTLPDPNSVISDVAVNGSGEFLAAPSVSAVLKYNGTLIVDPGTLPPYIDFGWQPLNGPYGGSLSGIRKSINGNLAVHSSNRIYTNSDTFSAPWVKATPPLNASLNAYLFDNQSGDLVMTDYARIFRSNDLGQSWTTQYTDFSTYRYDLIQMGDGTFVSYYEQYNPGLSRWEYNLNLSADGGTSFGTPIYTFPANTYRYYWKATSNNKIVLLQKENGNGNLTLQVTEDKGANWITGSFPPITNPVYNEGMYVSDGGDIFIQNWYTTPELFMSSDNGSTWNSILGDLPLTYLYPNRFWVAPDGTYYITIENGGQKIYKSSNGGANWTLAFSKDSGGIQRLEFTANDKLIMLDNIGVWVSADGGSTFTNESAGITERTFTDIEVLTNNALAISPGGEQSMISYDFQNFEENGQYIFKYHKRPNGEVVSYGAYSIYQTVDNGDNWDFVGENLPNYMRLMDSYDDETFYFSSGYDFYATTDFKSWTSLGVSGFPSNYEIRSIAVFAGDIIFANVQNYQLNKREIYRIENSSAVPITVGQDPFAIKFFTDRLLVYDRNGAIYESTDGENWIQKGAPSLGNNFVVDPSGYYFITQGNGVLWLSRDAGTTWQSVGIASGSSSEFRDVVINEFDGYAYGVLSNSAVLKSGQIIVPTESTAPTLVSFGPSATSSETLRPVLELTFSEAVTARQGKKIRIFDGATIAVTLDAFDDLTYQNGKTFYYELPVGITLGFGKTYNVRIDVPTSGNGTFEDLFSNNYAGITSDAIWQFTTRPAPTLDLLEPADDQTNVSIATDLTLTFSELTTIAQSKNLTLYKSTGEYVQQIYGVCIPSDQFAYANPTPFSARTAGSIFLDATQGGGELVGAAKVYAHAWAATHREGETESTIVGIGNWGEDDGIGEMVTAGSADQWMLNMPPTVREYFELPLDVIIDSVGVVFRNEDGSIKATPPSSIEGATRMPNGDVYFSVISTNSFSLSLCDNILEFNTGYYIQADANTFEVEEGAKLDLLTSTTAWNFTTEPAPTISTLSPANGSSGSVLTPTFSITFSTTLQTVPGKMLLVQETGTNAIVQQVPVEDLLASGNGFNFNLSVPLKYNTQYFVQALPGSFTLNGVVLNFLTNTTSWTFTTAPAPTVLGHTPANSATAVDLINSISVTFSEPVYAIADKFATLRTAGDNSVITQFSLTGLETDGNDVLTISLGSTILDFSTQYEIVFDADAFRTIDMVPFSVLSTDDDWVFTTRSAPTVVELSPVNNATDIARKPTVSITFSDPITVAPGGNVGFNPSPAPSSPVAFSEQGTVSGSDPNTANFVLSSLDLTFGETYFIKATVDAFVYKGRAFSVLTGDGQWNITIVEAPDGVAPVFDSFTEPLFVKNATSNALTVGVTDAASAIASVKLFHRKMRSEGAFTEVVMTSSGGNNYTTPVNASMLDELGLEYYFTATDASPTPNTKRMPAATDQFLSSGVKMENSDEPVLPSSVVGSGGQPANYKIFSIPFKLDNAAIPVVLSELGEPNRELYRLLTYNKTKPNGWAEYSGDFNSIERGKGYWLNAKNSVSLKLEGASTDDFSKGVPFTFNLAAGWNQIGNPYPFTIDWSDVKGGNTAVGNLYKFSNGVYSQGNTTLAAYEGGFVFVSGSSPVQLSAPISLGSGARQNRVEEDFSRGWLLPISVQQGEYVNDFTGIGMHPEASLSGDRFDNVTPPRFIEHLEANVAHPEHSGKNFSRDIVPTSSEYVWEFTVASNLEGIATFTWDYPEGNDFASGLFLFDVTLQRPVDMRTANSYSFDPKESSLFKIYYGENFSREFNPDHITLGQAYPNPTEGQLAVTFSLPEKGGDQQAVEVEMIDAVGRSLGVVAKGVYPAGYHEIEWNGEQTLTNTGLFTYRLSVSNRQGKEVLQGKIMVKK